MALTSTTTFDLIGQTQTITFFNPSQVDQIIFSSNQITFENSSAYNLTKSDLLLYLKYLIIYNNLLIANFPIMLSSYNSAWPLSVFDITKSDVGTTKIIYNQTSLGTTVLNIDYVPIASAASFVARVSPITITPQEFLMTINMLNQFSNQVTLN